MNAKTILAADYLDILFNDRNKAYGGYELRKHYSTRAQLAMAIVLAAVLLSLFALTRKKVPVYTAQPLEVITELSNIQPPTIPAIEQPLPPATASAPSPVERATPPKIVRDDDLRLTTIPEHNTVVTSGSASTSGGDKTGTGDSYIKPIIEVPGVTEAPAKAVKWVEQMPEFDGQLAEYLSKHIRYPSVAKENNIEGRVTVTFIVDEDGNISDTHIVRGIGAGCDEEAMRVVRSMPKWKPGKQNGKPVKVYLVLPIMFELN